MAKRHSDDTGQKAQLNRRDYMRLGGAAVAATALGGVAATSAVVAEPETVVNLGEEGLSEGDEIDPYLEEYVDNGVEVRVPAGEYDWDGEGFTGASGNAAIVGQGEVILNNTAGEYYQVIKATDGTIEVRNFTVRGEAEGNSSRFRLQTYSDSKIVVDNVNFPDGSEEGAEAKAFFVPPNHAGVVEIRNCYYAGFDDNGIYASPPGQSGEGGGQVIVENCTAHNNNISGIRIGSDDSIVRNCLVINDDAAPESPSGSRNQRGIRVRRAGDDILIEDCEIIHSYSGATAPIQLHRGAEGGSGTIRNVRILNNTDSDAISDQDGNTAEGWTGENIDITGDGDLDYPSKFDATVGSDAEAPTGEDPQGDTTTDSGSGDSGSGDSDSTDSGGADVPADGVNRLVVTFAADGNAGYEFTATGEITPLYDLAEFDANDDSVGETAVENDDGTWTATGRIGGTSLSGDSFDIDGDVTAFSAEGNTDAIELLLNGEEVSVDELVVDQSSDDGQSDDDQSTGDDQSSGDDQTGDSDDGSTTGDELTNVLLIDGTASDDLAQYKVTVSGEIERSTSLSSVASDGSPWDEIQDRVGESSATGVVAKGLDGYRFSGELVSFQVKGHVDLTLEQPDQ